jgi:hypothetical protein
MTEAMACVGAARIPPIGASASRVTVEWVNLNARVKLLTEKAYEDKDSTKLWMVDRDCGILRLRPERQAKDFLAD